jgi:hypothetical protein
MKMKDIIKEGDFDDFDLGGHGRELDQDDRDEGKGFEKDAMFDQLGKILDTRGGADPLTTVKTDDGQEITVDANQAAELRKLLRAEGMKPAMKLRFTKDLQMSNHLHDFVDNKDYHKIGAVFMQKYM